jgi:hypothetical protein
VFCVHEIVTVPDPLPLVGVTEIHVPFPVAVHAPFVHPEGMPVRVNRNDPAEDDGLTELGLTVKLVQVGGGAPA